MLPSAPPIATHRYAIAGAFSRTLAVSRSCYRVMIPRPGIKSRQRSFTQSITFRSGRKRSDNQPGDLALEARIPGSFVWILHLEVDIESLEQRAFGVPKRKPRILKVDIGRDLVTLRGHEFALELEQVVCGRHTDAKADLFVAQ